MVWRWFGDGFGDSSETVYGDGSEMIKSRFGDGSEMTQRWF